MVAVTEQVPVPLVMVTRVPTFEQAPEAAYVTAPEPEPPVLATVKLAPNVWALAETPVTLSAAWFARAAATVAAAEVLLV